MRKLLIVVFAACLSAAAQTAPAKSAPAAAPDKPLQALPYSPSLDLNDMDKSVDPCVDFYTYSCGGWQKKNPIPAISPRGASTASCTTTTSSSCGEFSTIYRSRPPGALRLSKKSATTLPHAWTKLRSRSLAPRL